MNVMLSLAMVGGSVGTPGCKQYDPQTVVVGAGGTVGAP